MLRLTGIWRALDTMFWNHTSDATFQILPPDAIFCDHASDVYHEWHSVWNNLKLCARWVPVNYLIDHDESWQSFTSIPQAQYVCCVFVCALMAEPFDL